VAHLIGHPSVGGHREPLSILKRKKLYAISTENEIDSKRGGREEGER
jgi:hypothetical protein